MSKHNRNLNIRLFTNIVSYSLLTFILFLNTSTHIFLLAILISLVNVDIISDLYSVENKKLKELFKLQDRVINALRKDNE